MILRRITMALTKIQKALNEAFTPFVALIDGAAQKVQAAEVARDAAEVALGVSRIALGRVVAESNRTLLALGGSAEAVTAMALTQIQKTLPNVGEWKTVEAWIHAATVMDELPEAMRTTLEEREVSADTMVVIGRVKDDDREAFVQTLIDNDTTSIRDAREALAEYKEANPSAASGKRDASQSEKAVKALKRLLKEAGIDTDDSEDPERDAALIVVGWTLGAKKCPKFRVTAIQSAADEVCFPEDDAADEDDGSGAEDAS